MAATVAELSSIMEQAATAYEDSWLYDKCLGELEQSNTRTEKARCFFARRRIPVSAWEIISSANRETF